MSNYQAQAIAELAAAIKKAGYRVFIASSGTYGFYTDAQGTRLVSFQYDLGGIKFSGNYKTNNPRSTGTGWVIGTGYDRSAVGFRTMLESGAPSWAVRDAEWRYTTLAEHMKVYQSSSKYTELLEAQ